MGSGSVGARSRITFTFFLSDGMTREKTCVHFSPSIITGDRLSSKMMCLGKARKTSSPRVLIVEVCSFQLWLSLSHTAVWVEEAAGAAVMRWVTNRSTNPKGNKLKTHEPIPYTSQSSMSVSKISFVWCNVECSWRLQECWRRPGRKAKYRFEWCTKK